MRFSYLLAIFAIVHIYSAATAAAPGNGIAATVNGAEILELKLQSATEDYLREQGSDLGAVGLGDSFQQVRLRVLDVLIGQELLWQAATADGTLASDAEVEAVYAQTRAQFDSDAEFEARLQEGGYSAQSYHEDIRRRLSAQKWVESRVLATVSIDDAAVSRFYEENRAEFTFPEQLHARHILRKLGADSSDTERQAARELLEDIRRRVEAGEDFAALAREHSEDGSAARGGDLGFFGPGMMVKPFEQAAFALSPGETSAIVETRFGLHLIQLVERKPGGVVALADAAAQIRTYLFQQSYQQALVDAVENLRENAEIEINNL